MTSCTTNLNDQRTPAQAAPARSAMSACPMAAMCAGMMKKRAFRWLSMLSGILLIAIGVLIIVEPMVLTWLAAGGSILLGIMLLTMSWSGRHSAAAAGW